ncbi:MAG TPA: GNAT family N-acetyltransferase, partial [Actinomycetes bacterium]|nr:GNAT family N-acetyltransferase [Actinomycetes bacterium]
AVTRPARPTLRSARPDDLAWLGPLYEQSGFGARLAGVVGFARARLDGEVVVAEAGGELVGVAAGAVFTGTGWVGGVAVVPGHRRAGLGGALTEAIVEFLEGRGVTTVLLHATALGRPVYERLGFVPEAAYLTLTGPTRPPSPGDPSLRAGRQSDLETVLALDLAATGEDRRRLLTALWPTGGLVAAGDGRLLGYHLASPWRSGGAVIATDPEAGRVLLDAVRVAPGDEVGISVPAANTPAVQSLESAGFSERYRTVRMHRGPRVPWNPAALFGAHNLFWG